MCAGCRFRRFAIPGSIHGILDAMRSRMTRSWTVPEIPHLECFWAVGLVHEYPRQSHETWAIGVVDGGTGGIWYRGENQRGGPGEVIVISPGEVHTGYLACLFLRHARAKAQEWTGREPAHVARIREYLRVNLNRNARLSELATLTGLSKAYVVRYSRRLLGMPPYEWLLQLRIEESRKGLQKGSSISDLGSSRQPA